MFAAPKLTDAGKALYYENMGGAGITFTTIQMGKGTLSGSIASLTALVDPVVTMDAAVTNNQNQYCDVSGKFSNASLAEGFYWREIGVFAADPNYPDDRNKDILYCYQNAHDTADFIPVASVQTVEKNITVPVIVGDAATVTCALIKSLILATVKDLEDHNSSETAHKELFAGIATMNAAEYSEETVYDTGAYCTKGGKLYRCITGITEPEAWTVEHWKETSVCEELTELEQKKIGIDSESTVNITIGCDSNGVYIVTPDE